MRVKVVSLFSDFVATVANYSVTKKAIIKQQLQIEFIDLHKYGLGEHHQVDDYQYGGGAGMVLMAPVMVKTIEAVRARTGGMVIFLTPQGQQLNQNMVVKLAQQKKALILVCGHFEGIDERVRSYFDLELSIGDYVLSGGELPAMVLINALSRSLPGVIKKQSVKEESFTGRKLDHPVYTRPIKFRHQKVPPVLISGDHKAIKKWRTKASTAKTQVKRPDLLK